MAKAYKEHWSGYREWEERGHADRYLVMGGNTGPRLSIDESSLTRGELYTSLTNKDGRGRKGTLVAVVRGTGSDTVSDVLASIPLRDRKTVREVSMDFSESMRAIVERSFPDARIVVDRFHVVRLATEAMQQERIALRKEAMKQTAELRKSLMEAGAMAVKMAGHAVRIKRLGIPRLENGDTPAELLARSQYLLCTSPDRWSESQAARARLLFLHYPSLKQAYGLVQQLRSVYRCAKSLPDAAARLQQWHCDVLNSPFDHLKVAADTILSRQDHVLHFFIDRSTNAYAESVNAKIKNFRSALRGVSDPAFFLFRLSRILG